MKHLKKKQMENLIAAERRLMLAKMELKYSSEKTIEDAMNQIDEAMIFIEDVICPFKLKK